MTDTAPQDHASPNPEPEPAAGWRGTIEKIWYVDGSVAVPAGMDALDRLLPLFDTPGTTTSRSGHRLTFVKKDPGAQDRLSVFGSGILEVAGNDGERRLGYRLRSPSLLACFLAPLLFLGLAGLTTIIANSEKAAAEKEAAAKTDDKKKEKEDKVWPLHPIDNALGAPEPEKPKKDKKKDSKAKDGKTGKDGEEDEDEDDKGPSPTPAYVFAGIFAALYAIGRWLEAHLVRRLFQQRLLAGDDAAAPSSG